MVLMVVRHYPGPAGARLRFHYYRRRLAALGPGTRIDEGVHLVGEKHIHIGANCWIAANAFLGAGPTSTRHREVSRRDNPEFGGDEGELFLEDDVYVGPPFELDRGGDGGSRAGRARDPVYGLAAGHRVRLLYVGNTASPHFRAWPAHFARRGHEVHVLHFAPGPGSAVEGARLHELPGLVWSLRGGWRLGALGLRHVSRRVHPHVLHTQQVIPSSYAGCLARIRPHVATAWGSEVLLAPKPHQRRLVARVARTADLLTADSEHVLAVLGELGADPERRRLVPWGFERAWLEPAVSRSRDEAARRAGLPAGRTIVLSPRGTLDLYEPETVLRGLAAAAKTV